jgi:hypothetical protein
LRDPRLIGVSHTADRAYSQALEVHWAFNVSGSFSSELAQVCIHLALLERVARGGPNFLLQGDFNERYDAEVEDLSRLWSLIPSNQFLADYRCILNPTFGAGSRLTGGADADLIIDNTLVEIKTTTVLALQASYVYQLVGYCLLSLLAASEESANEISKIGVYFARHGYLHLMELADVIDPPGLEELKIFLERVPRLRVPEAHEGC